MKYYRVKKTVDVPTFLSNGGYYYHPYMEGELYTEKELQKLGCKNKSLFDVINISKRAVYFFFGKRFA